MSTHPPVDAEAIVAQLNHRQPEIIRSLQGRVLAYAPERRELRMGFEIGTALCHSVDIVQGGIVTAMLDASMAHVVLASEPGVVNVASIDIHVSFLRPSRAGSFTAVGSYLKSGRTVAFLKAELFNAAGELVSAATSSAHLTRAHAQAAAPAPPG
jgi:uncharacterized protein (TIGR00369 family)